MKRKQGTVSRLTEKRGMKNREDCIIVRITSNENGTEVEYKGIVDIDSGIEVGQTVEFELSIYSQIEPTNNDEKILKAIFDKSVNGITIIDGESKK